MNLRPCRAPLRPEHVRKQLGPKQTFQNNKTFKTLFHTNKRA